MNRHEYVLKAAVTGSIYEPLINLARMFVHTLEQNEAEGTDPMLDPATLVLGAFIAFRTHADINTMTEYQKLLAACELRVSSPRELQ